MLQQYKNGNSLVTIHKNGTREIEYEDTLSLEYPLNIDIRVSTQCSFGKKPDGTSVLCNFCHESALVNGVECDFELLKDKLFDLPQGIELAIGSNNYTNGLDKFLGWCQTKGYICNVTINQGHIQRDFVSIMTAIREGRISGLGISYRNSLKWNIPEEILNYPNTVFHVISGIDDINDVIALKEKGVKKVLVLGEKDFGFNEGKVDLTTQKHKEWYWYISKLFNIFEVVSFDNLGLEQMNIRRFFNDSEWETFNQGEHSHYINAVDKYFAPSSRSSNTTDWDDITIKDYFSSLEI